MKELDLEWIAFEMANMRVFKLEDIMNCGFTKEEAIEIQKEISIRG